MTPKSNQEHNLKEVTSGSVEQTTELALKVAKRSIEQKSALVIALKGELGSGKTTFAQGFAKGLGVKGRILSPTFVLMRQYEVPRDRYDKLYHIDCYRMSDERELEDLGWKDIVSDPKNVVLIEWPERVHGIMPEDHIEISFEHSSLDTRYIKLPDTVFPQ